MSLSSIAAVARRPSVLEAGRGAPPGLGRSRYWCAGLIETGMNGVSARTMDARDGT